MASSEGEVQGALPLDPAKEPFEKRFFGISKTFYKFLSCIFYNSVLPKRNDMPYGAPTPQVKQNNLFCVETGEQCSPLQEKNLFFP